MPSDVTLEELAELRAASGAPIDLYLEAPDALGGMVRGNELAEIALVSAPLYAKFGLRNARMVYPAGEQNMTDVVANVREKEVRRAVLALEFLDAFRRRSHDLQARRRRDRGPRAMTLRSDRWVRGDDEVALDSRVALNMAGASVDASGGRPIIGLANSSSDLNPCNQPLSDYIAPLRASIEAAGAIAVEFPVLSLGEDLMKPSAMLYRNLLSDGHRQSRCAHQPLDGVVVLAACDKSVPGAA